MTPLSARPFIILLALSSLFLSSCRWTPLIDRDLFAQLEARVAQNGSPGLLLAVFDRRGVEFKALGAVSLSDRRSPNEHDLFEIGSITKVFTALLLADSVTRGELFLDDPAEQRLGPGVRLPRLKGKAFTLLDLVTHRSGLPRDAQGIGSSRMLSDSELLDLATRALLISEPGSKLHYSNFGTSLLGLAVARQAGSDYSTLLRERILQPLGLSETGLDLPPGGPGRLVSGAQPALELQAIRPAGGLKASASDLVRFMRLTMEQLPSPLRGAMDLSLKPQPGREPLALGWFIGHNARGPVYYHSGRTLGSQALACFSPADGKGVVLLWASPVSMDDLGFAFMDPAALKAGDWSTTVEVDAASLQALAGAYKLSSGHTLTINTRPSGLSAQFMGSFDVMSFEPQSPVDYFNVDQHVRLHFNMDPNGKVHSLDIRWPGVEQKWNLPVVF